MKPSSYLIGLLMILIVIILVARPSPIIVAGGGSGIQYNSVRKHPFDVYADPYHPPERENPYMFGKDSSYQQVGILQSNNKSGILPLFGRPTPNSNSRWEYFTMTDGIKLPVSYNKKSCTGQPGCDELVNPDILDVMGLGSFKANLYDVKQPQYNPGRF